MSPENTRRLSTLADRARACRENLDGCAALPYVHDLLDHYESEIALPDGTAAFRLFVQARRLHYLADRQPRTQSEADIRASIYDKRPRAAWAVDPQELAAFLTSDYWEWRRTIAGPVFALAAAPETVEEIARTIKNEGVDLPAITAPYRDFITSKECRAAFGRWQALILGTRKRKRKALYPTFKSHLRCPWTVEEIAQFFEIDSGGPQISRWKPRK